MLNIKKLLLIPLFAIMCIFTRIDSATAVDYPFSITTTNQTSSSWNFQFIISAKGTFYVDCGANGTLSRVSGGSATVSGTTITKTGNVSNTTFKCQYTSSGSKTIRFGGTATAYGTGSSTSAISFFLAIASANSALVASISGNLSTIFPNLGADLGQHPVFYVTFQNCTNLTSIPDTLFSGYTTGASYMFYRTFYGCTGLTSIPANLFSHITTAANYMFNFTFQYCSGLTSIPVNLFSKITSGAEGMFYYTFLGCTGLTSIPANLFFPNATSVSGAERMFYSTFQGCTGLTSIPENLFSRVTTSASSLFYYTFSGCTGLTSIPADLFKNITTGAQSMFGATFYGCTGLTSIPANLFSHITTAANYMFQYTFYGCTNLTGTVPWTLFSGLIENGSPTATNMMLGVFSNTGLSMTCPSGKIQYKTGYESEWSGKVACGDPISCASGKYLPAGSTTCNASCPSGYSCPAGTVGFSVKSDENKYAPITLTWDGANTTPASCNVGGTFVPPTPTRPGYIFAGWRQTCASKIRNLDTNIDGSAFGYTKLNGSSGSNESNYGLTTGSGQWAVEFPYGTVWGMVNCNNTIGTNSVAGTPNTSVSGKYCWCQVTGFTASGNSYTSGPQCTTATSSKWVYQGSWSNESGCATSCGSSCTNGVVSPGSFRAAIFGVAGQ